MNKRKNRLHERALQIAHKDYVSNFHEFLEKSKPVTMHTRNIRALVTKMYKIHHNISPSFMIKIMDKADVSS